MNWDATVDKQNQQTDIGFVARDHEGNVLLQSFHVRSTSSRTVEALTAQRLPNLVEIWGYKISYKNVTLQAIKAVNTEERNWSCIGQLI